ncbi:unnamed protein product [Larinioides sclopetarius]|uniref:Uncharacterized protein n=1 Tax=Larinioides sclopetarius TaxID=280406 RepID=A0AAV2B0K4_9ARAC
MMLSSKSILVWVLVVVLVATTCHGYAFSMACKSGPDGKMLCTQNNDPSSSSSVASSNGQLMSGTWRGYPYGWGAFV